MSLISVDYHKLVSGTLHTIMSTLWFPVEKDKNIMQSEFLYLRIKSIFQWYTPAYLCVKRKH